MRLIEIPDDGSVRIPITMKDGTVWGERKLDLSSFPSVPLRHGRWVEQWNDDYMRYFHFCSECGKDALTKEETMHDEVLSLYCPNCGAKMDEEK